MSIIPQKQTNKNYSSDVPYKLFNNFGLPSVGRGPAMSQLVAPRVARVPTPPAVGHSVDRCAGGRNTTQRLQRASVRAQAVVQGYPAETEPKARPEQGAPPPQRL